MPLPSAEELVAALDVPDFKAVHKARAPFSRGRGVRRLAPVLIAAFPRLTQPAARISVMCWLTKWSRQVPEVVDLAVSALWDQEYMVRYEACSALAYSVRRDALPALEKLRGHTEARTRADAEAAIDAITSGNHNYWYDREHSGRITWLLSPGD